MKKWYQRFEWGKVTEPAFRWIAIAMVSILAPSAISLGTSEGTTIHKEQSTENTSAIDSLRKCMQETTEEVRALKIILREKNLNDSNSRINIQQQISFTRDDVADIKRLLMSRAFANAR